MNKKILQSLTERLAQTWPHVGSNGASLVAQMVKNLPEMQKTWVQSLGWEDPLEEGMATQSSILAWRIPMDRGAWRATVHGVTESDTTEQLSIAQGLTRGEGEGVGGIKIC